MNLPWLMSSWTLSLSPDSSPSTSELLTAVKAKPKTPKTPNTKEEMLQATIALLGRSRCWAWSWAPPPSPCCPCLSPHTREHFSLLMLSGREENTGKTSAGRPEGRYLPPVWWWWTWGCSRGSSGQPEPRQRGATWKEPHPAA